ncbi:serine/threonine protein kinase [Candidatus Viridilinea mediisalina]|uniref:non-specific serine/threonine protein kinase n=1 Tax=Candidatus Viridilinea mediisalina TaxID=2024553 RepID=A0A2A6RKA5_9CHLR|nr:serine/threonine-protein kinase [Candidatus Viridilinea mediisalina]PDW03351.1 hypothetical protein CJ255_09200 [Candidatus Viridilinea mediisalina]
MNQAILCPACYQSNAPQTRYCRLCSHDLILTNVGQRYFLTRLIKVGRLGAIFEGHDESGRVYLIKELLDRFSNPNERAEALAHFQSEAEILGRLNHPQIPRFYATFVNQGRHYSVLDFINGATLAELVAREGPLPEAQVLAWATQLCTVLEYLHDQELIYGDMQPANVLLEEATGNLKLIDFSHATVFQPNMRVSQRGTRGYMPPEQYRGLTTKQSDIYALGATLHHLLSGRTPDPASFSFAPLRALVPTITPQSEALVARALDVQQANRFQSIAELRTALVAAQAARAQADLMPTPVAAVQPAPLHAPQPEPESGPPPVAMFFMSLQLLIFCAFVLMAFFSVVTDACTYALEPPPPTLVATINPQTLPVVSRSISYTLEVSFDDRMNLTDRQFKERFNYYFIKNLAEEYACCSPMLTSGIVFTEDPEIIGTFGNISFYRATMEATVRLRGENIP